MSDQANHTRRLKFLKIDKDMLARLTELKPLISKALPGVLEEFYGHLNDFPELNAFFTSSAIKSHAAERQLAHWLTILDGRFDEDYLASAKKVGATHARIGLEPRWYIAGYNFLISKILPQITVYALSKYGKGKTGIQSSEVLQNAFLTVAMLDIEICTSVYMDDTMQDRRREMMSTLADKFEADVSSIAEAVASASTELENTARAMTEIAERTSSRSISVSAAMEQATTNVSSVARSADEMGGAISEISRQASHASGIASGAVETAQATNETMERLTACTDKIGAVVSLISDIAAQTNLLALNATIESARAGEAGKGFAVVASEVKSLATQTAKATEDIAKQIQDMQQVAKQSVTAIDQIRKTIAEINHVTIAINAAVEEQSSSTREIAGNTHEAAEGTKEVTTHIMGVQQNASETGAAAHEVVAASGELGRQAEHLRTEVKRFLESFRAA